MTIIHQAKDNLTDARAKCVNIDTIGDYYLELYHHSYGGPFKGDVLACIRRASIKSTSYAYSRCDFDFLVLFDMYVMNEAIL